MDIKQMNDNVFEALFRQAIMDEYNEEIESIPQKEELANRISLSSEFELRMKKLLSLDRRKSFLKKAIYYGKRVAAIFLFAVTILFLALLTNPGVRAAIKHTIIEWYDKYTAIIFEGQKNNDDNDTIKEFKPGYLPEGYNEVLAEKLGEITEIEYANGLDGVIYMSYWPETHSNNISIDNENHIIESGTINGHEAYIAKATDDDFYNGIIWTMKGYRFSIWSKQPIDELVKIIESIKEY